MALSYYWSSLNIQVVCFGVVSVITFEDPRYPWVAAALVHGEQAVYDAVAGVTPEPQGYEWTVQYEDTDTQAWETLNTYYDFGQACSVASAYLLSDPNVDKVQVINNDQLQVYALTRMKK